MRATTCFALLPAASTLMMGLLGHVPRASGHTYNVMSDAGSSSDSSDDGSSASSSSVGLNAIDNKVYSLPDALSRAKPGDVIVLANGTYTDRLESYSDGEEGNPITIVGAPGAVLQSVSPSVHIEHSWITLEGFTVDGNHGSAYEADSFVNKCVEVIGKGQNETEALEGFVMKNMIIQHCGGECVRLKNFVINANITDNTIQHCGMYDFEFASNSTDVGKNGEGIYIGTSSKQWTYGEDRCNGNTVSGNRIATYGNECVEVKEGSSVNMIENNVCSNQRDANSGCFCSRGDSNTFRFNNVSDCEGAGVRLGGWEKEGHQYGQNNSVYGNNIIHVDNGAVSVNASPQQVICDNTCEGSSCELRGDDDSLGDIDGTWDTSCPTQNFENDGGEEDDDTDEEEREEEEEEGSASTPSPVESTPSPVASTPSPVEQEEDDDSGDDDIEDADDDDTNSVDDDATSDDAGDGVDDDASDDDREDDFSIDDDATTDARGDDDRSSDDTASSGDDSSKRRLRGTAN